MSKASVSSGGWGTVGAVCVREVVVAEATDSILEIAALMRQHHVGDVVICTRRGTQRFPIGMITDRDLVIDALATQVDRIRELLATDLITRPVVTIREDAAVDDALERMREHGVRRIPVVDEHEALVGILAVDDLIELTAERLSGLTRLMARGQQIERDARS